MITWIKLWKFISFPWFFRYVHAGVRIIVGRSVVNRLGIGDDGTVESGDCGVGLYL